MATAPDDDDFVLVGRVVKPHGLLGEVLIKVLSENPSRFDAGAQLLVGKDPSSADLREVASSRVHQDRLLLQFEDSASLEDAELLRDLLIFVEKDALEELSEGEFWEHELVGLAVVHRNGRPLGTVAEVIDRPGQDLWSIRTQSGDVLFPAAEPLVVSVDLEAGTIVIDPPEGLFD
jgi:16S rRNA processing protein RimM